MLKQRYSSSGLSAKTLSRSKFINHTFQQPHNVSTESGKQGRTLRYQNKNKSCLISRHLAQSTQSHIVCSNESSRYKTNSRNHRQTQKIQANSQNINPNTQKNTSKLHYDLHSRGNLIESKLTQPYQNQHNRTSLLRGQSQLRFSSYKPFLSVPDQQSHLKANILSRLSDLTQNISSTELPQNNIIPHQLLQRAKSNNIQANHKAATNTIMRQKVLDREVKQSFLYKNMQLTKALQEMHRFCISVTELKWICEEVNLIIKKYNQQIASYYQEFCTAYNNKRTDLQNILTESEQLLKRFNQLQMMNTTATGQLFNFNLLLANNNNMFNSSLIDQKDDKSLMMMNNNHKHTTEINSSPENQHSWSKLIQNIQQNPLLNKQDCKIAKNIASSNNNNNNLQTFPNNNEENKNFTIRTFQVTQTNSPYKNKTLNELIRLSQLRKTEFLSNYCSSGKENNSNQINILPKEGQRQIQERQRQSLSNENNKFNKKPRQQEIGLTLISPDKDPFDSIHLPHFNTKPENITIQNDQSHHSILQAQQFYESQIMRLNSLIDKANQQNIEIHRKMDVKNQQLMKENQLMKVKISKQQQSFNSFQKSIYKLVQTALNELINCAKVSESIMDHRKESYSINNLRDIGFHQQKNSRAQQMIIIGNKSFFDLIHCLQEVFKLNRYTNITKANYNFQRPTNKINNNDTLKTTTITQKPPTTNTTSHNNTDIMNKFNKEKDSLMKQIVDLSLLKSQLEQEIIRQEQDLRQVGANQNSINCSAIQDYNQLTQIIFAQAFTIEDMLQLDHEE